MKKKNLTSNLDDSEASVLKDITIRHESNRSMFSFGMADFLFDIFNRFFGVFTFYFGKLKLN